jgi:hypothetical protein
MFEVTPTVYTFIETERAEIEKVVNSKLPQGISIVIMDLRSYITRFCHHELYVKFHFDNSSESRVEIEIPVSIGNNESDYDNMLGALSDFNVTADKIVDVVSNHYILSEPERLDSPKGDDNSMIGREIYLVNGKKGVVYQMVYVDKLIGYDVVYFRLDNYPIWFVEDDFITEFVYIEDVVSVSDKLVQSFVCETFDVPIFNSADGASHFSVTLAGRDGIYFYSDFIYIVY